MHRLISNKNILISLVIIICTLIPVCLVFFYSQDVPLNFVQKYDTLVYVQEEENIFTLRKFEDGVVKLFKNEQELSDLGYNTSTMKCLEMPKVSKKFDISSEAPASDLTWNIAINQSAGYVLFLKESGYEIIREARTYDYIDLYMKNKEGNRKRLIIFKNSLICGDLTELSELPDINTYFQKYNVKINAGG